MPLCQQEGAKSAGGSASCSKETEGGGTQGDEEADKGSPGQAKRYLTLRTVLRFSFQHPPLLFPVVHFQRVLRSKIIGEDDVGRVGSTCVIVCAFP